MASENDVSSLSSTFDLKIFVKDVCDRHGRKRPILVKTWSTVKDVKDQIRSLLHIPQSSQRLYFSSLLVSAKELPNHRTLQDAGIYRSGETLLLDVVKTGLDESTHGSSPTSLRSYTNDICVSLNMLETTPKALRNIVQQARRGMTLGIKPALVLDGSGGTYFLHNARKAIVAVFKPADEEPYAENNPRGYVKRGANDDTSLRLGIQPGEACLREVAAYMLDHGEFSGVPMTTLTEARHPAFNNNMNCSKVADLGATLGTLSLVNNKPENDIIKKVGSCQEFICSECTMDDISPSMISKEEVHKIAILDIRLMNADRNVANILCRRKPNNAFELVPIDHGFCLRSVCDICWYDWCWLDWPQMKEPLSRNSKEFINNLDIEADVRLLKERLTIEPEAINLFRASSKLLKIGVQLGLTLHEIATLCCRPDNAGLVRSKLEIISSQAHELATSALENGKWHHVTASSALVDKIVMGPTERLLSDSSKCSMSRSKSSIFISSHSFLRNEISSSKSKAPPSMTHTSCSSDSDYEIEDIAMNNEDDACDKWAAAVIDNVDIEKSSEFISRDRSSSSCSSESDDLSEFGFWHVKPCTDISDYSDSVWSPMFCGLGSTKQDVPTAVDIKKPVLAMHIESAPEPRVMFNHDQHLDSDITSVRKMGRSQSYSNFSSRTLSDSQNFLPRINQHNSNYEQYNTYVLKFIDLLTERVAASVITSLA